MKCRKCGRDMPQSAMFCPGCGWKVKKKSHVSKIVVIVLGIIVIVGAGIGIKMNSFNSKKAEEAIWRKIDRTILQREDQDDLSKKIYENISFNIISHEKDREQKGVYLIECEFTNYDIENVREILKENAIYEELYEEPEDILLNADIKTTILEIEIQVDEEKNYSITLGEKIADAAIGGSVDSYNLLTNGDVYSEEEFLDMYSSVVQGYDLYSFLDLNDDHIKELAVSRYMCVYTSEGNEYQVTSADIYTFDGQQVVWSGTVSKEDTGLLYGSEDLSLRSSITKKGVEEKIFCNLNSNYQLQFMRLDYNMNNGSYYYGTTGCMPEDEISSEEYVKYNEKWEKAEELYFKALTYQS